MFSGLGKYASFLRGGTREICVVLHFRPPSLRGGSLAPLVYRGACVRGVHHSRILPAKLVLDARCGMRVAIFWEDQPRFALMMSLHDGGITHDDTLVVQRCP